MILAGGFVPTISLMQRIMSVGINSDIRKTVFKPSLVKGCLSELCLACNPACAELFTHFAFIGRSFSVPYYQSLVLFQCKGFPDIAISINIVLDLPLITVH